MIVFKLAAATKVREKAFAFGFVLDKTTAYIITQIKMLACNGIFMIAFKLAAATKVRKKASAFGFVP